MNFFGVRRRSFGAVAAALCLCATFAVAASAKAATHTVTMEGTSVNPPSLTVKQGDHVVWVNKDPFPHTVTAQDRSFDSGSLAAGKKWKWTAKKRGEFPYICTLHPNMKGTLTVN